MFTDRIKVSFLAGKGGNGVVAWRREKYIPKGGPTGGNGGEGGSIILKAAEGMHSLDAFRDRRIVKAENGRTGGSNQRQGRAGKNEYIIVPCGTMVFDAATGDKICDLTEEGQEWILCCGGKGGRGNASFRTSVNRAPNFWTPGKEGEEKTVRLELKLIADVGLVGFPNAGKSTLLRSLSHAHVKCAAYPFTTLVPQLAFIQYPNYEQLLVADIPGIIEGAHDNRGLGLQFLRHIERCRGLIFVLDASGIEGRMPWEDWEVLRRELQAYGAGVLDKPFIIALNKTDEESAPPIIEKFCQEMPDVEFFTISALTGSGIEELKEALRSFLSPLPH